MSDTKSKAKEILEKYRRAGEISIEAKKLAVKITKPGAKAYDIVQEIENYIRKQGAVPSFPVNFSINNEAAHYSPEILDDRVVGSEDTIKIDLGAHIDGYIVDTAITINFNRSADDLCKAAEEALDNAIEVAKAGVDISELGRVIEKTIVDAGYQPVRNLSGHQIKRYVLHAGVSIPNHAPGKFKIQSHKLKKGSVYAIEPFASTGPGEIKEGKRTNIFRVLKKGFKGKKEINQILARYYPKVGVLPFSPRFVFEPSEGRKGKETVTNNLRKLRRYGIIMGYPVLVEVDPKANVSQYEHTIIVKENGCEVLT